jgi:hypothetical protein
MTHFSRSAQCVAVFPYTLSGLLYQHTSDFRIRFILCHTSTAVDSRKLEMMDIAHSGVQVTIMVIPFMAVCKVDLSLISMATGSNP